jgi:archaemetzincin
MVLNTFGFRTKYLSLLKDVDFALDQNRSQYNSTLILNKLASVAPLNTIRILALCNIDLFIPIFTHVFGEAQLGGKTCVISTYRLKSDLPVIKSQRTYHDRIIKEAIHELGHTFNLRHCSDPFCGMHYCRTIKDVDNKSDEFCRYCRILLKDEIERIAE